MATTFKRPSILRIGTDRRLTDHNRSELSVDYERIETRQRMANGTMRKYWVADKRTFTVSWTDTPNVAAKTVDGFWSGKDIQTFYNSPDGRGVFSIQVFDNSPTASAVPTTHNVIITSFNFSVKKRWANWELWDFSLTMEEV